MLLYRSAFVEQTFPPLGMGIIVERKTSFITVLQRSVLKVIGHYYAVIVISSIP